MDLYKVHIEEVRFQTKFNWDRTQYFLVLNLGIVGAAAGIWKAEIALTGLYLLGMLFLCGIFICIMSISAMRQGHKYYRRSVLQKSKVEILLGLHDVVSSVFQMKGQDLSTISTPGKEEAIRQLDNPEAYLNRPLLRRGQINWYLQWFLYLICLVDVSGLIMVIFQLVPLAIYR